MPARPPAPARRAAPGLARRDRARTGSLAWLLREAQEDPSLHAGLIEAYLDLSGLERRLLARCVSLDAAGAQIDVWPALGALLEVEKDPSLREILREEWRGFPGIRAFFAPARGLSSENVAALMLPAEGSRRRALYARWSPAGVELEGLDAIGGDALDRALEARSGRALPPAPVRSTTDALVPLLWAQRPLPKALSAFAPLLDR
ncbi:MAG: hypothetical protein OEY14_00715 [Myxococcales bacterium]|nr:hypothetical protein [Myxococcales bacterium]